MLSSFKDFGDIIQFSQLLIQGLVDHFVDFSGFFSLPAISLFIGISARRQAREEVEGKGTTFYYSLVNDFLWKLRFFAEMRILYAFE